ncbi:MAG: thioredoxin family protein [Acidimicrobiia bacterium]
MRSVNLTKETFNDTVVNNDMVIIDWWAEWCPPCKSFAPVYDAAAKAHPDIVFGKIDTEAEPELSAGASISSIPTIMAFREGILVFRQSGALPAPAVEELISRLRTLDMDELRRVASGRKF